MSEKIKNSLKQKIVNFFGALGYLFCSLQWFWAVLLYFSLIKKLAIYLIGNGTKSGDGNILVQTQSTAGNFNQGALGFIIMLLIFSVVLSLTVYCLCKIPIVMAKTSEKIIHKASTNAVPILLKIQHKEESEKNKLKLTPRVILILKITGIILPILLAALSYRLNERVISFDVAMVIVGWLAVFSAVFFILQYLLTNIFDTKSRDIL